MWQHYCWQVSISQHSLAAGVPKRRPHFSQLKQKRRMNKSILKVFVLKAAIVLAQGTAEKEFL